MAAQEGDEIQQWMEEIAQKKTPKKKLVFDPQTKTLKLVSPTDRRAADSSREFTKQEATRFLVQT